MPVKHWTFAGLILTYRCDACCASCYLAGGPGRQEAEMTVESALAIWEQLIAASPHGCRVHLSGGEPFLDWPRLIEVCRRARSAGLGPLQKVETNANWATDDAVAADRLRQLDRAGMEKLGISADPYHQQHVPIDRPRRLARLGEELLGAARVQVRWRDWLAEGCDVWRLDEPARRELLARYARLGRDRLNGRAGEALADDLLAAGAPGRTPEDLAWRHCREALLRSRHVHIDGAGLITPGACAGIVLGQVGPGRTVADTWRQMNDDHVHRPVVGALSRAGPAGLLELATGAGYRPAEGYASRCHLCWSIRRHLARRGLHLGELGPPQLYNPQDATCPPAIAYNR